MRFRKGITMAGVALAVSALGSGTAFATNCAKPASAHEYSQDHLTSKATITATVTGLPGQDAPTCVTVNGAIDYTAMQGNFAVNTSSTQGSQATRMIIDGTDIYTMVPASDLGSTSGKPWVKVDAQQESQMLGFDFNMLNSDDNYGPLHNLIKDVDYVGHDHLRGVQTKHYTATIDFAAAAENANDANQKASFEQLASLYSKPVNVDVWLDHQNRVRKMTFAMDLSNVNVPNSNEHLAGTVNISVELYDYGTPVNVTVPDASQVANLNEVTAAQPATAAAA